MLVTVAADFRDTATFNCLTDGTPGSVTHWYIYGMPLEGKCACECVRKTVTCFQIELLVYEKEQHAEHVLSRHFLLG